MGLIEYMRASGELRGDFDYSVYLNGQTWASGTVSKENIDESQSLEVEIARLLVDEANRLIIERHEAGAGQTGEGQLYYSAQLRYYLPSDHIQALDRGIMVARQYSPVEDPMAYVDSAQSGRCDQGQADHHRPDRSALRGGRRPAASRIRGGGPQPQDVEHHWRAA